jgi:hypothetical protein
MSFKVHGPAPALWHPTISHETTAKTSPQSQQTISTIAATAFTAIKEDKNKIRPNAGDDLSLTDDDIKNIHTLFKELGKTSTFGLALKQKKIENLGKKLDSIHPLAVWKHVMTVPKLKSYVDQIKNKNLVWNSLLKQYAEKLKIQYAEGSLTTENVKHFLHSLNKTSKLQIDKNTDWSHFLKSTL